MNSFSKDELRLMYEILLQKHRSKKTPLCLDEVELLNKIAVMCNARECVAPVGKECPVEDCKDCNYDVIRKF